MCSSNNSKVSRIVCIWKHFYVKRNPWFFLIVKHPFIITETRDPFFIFCFQTACLVLSLYFKFDEHQYEVARSRFDWQHSSPLPSKRSSADCVKNAVFHSNSKQSQLWNYLWKRISIFSTALLLDFCFTNGKLNVWTHLKVFPFGYSFLINDSPVSQYITLPWPLSGILIVEEIPQSPTTR